MNILPSSVYELFGFGELKPTLVTLQLADRSIKVPRGMLEDVLVKVDEFFFPVDFLVLDMELNGDPRQVPIILGRPILATTNACINCRTGVMDVSFGNKKLRLNIFDASQGPSTDSCFTINTLEDTTEEATPIILAQDPLEACLAHFNMDSFDIDGYMKEVNVLLEPPTTTPPWIQKYEPIPSFLDMPRESPPTIEQEPLLVMINDPTREHDEISDQETQLVGAQNRYKEAIKEIATIDCPLQLPSYKPNHAVLRQTLTENPS